MEVTAQTHLVWAELWYYQGGCPVPLQEEVFKLHPDLALEAQVVMYLFARQMLPLVL